MIFFVQVARQSSIRFVFPQSVFLAVYAGFAADYILERVKGRHVLLQTWKITLAMVIAISLYFTLSVNMTMLHDARYKAEKWMRDNVPPGSTVEYYTYIHYLPRFPAGVNAYRVKEGALDIESRKPDFLVLNSTMIKKYRGKALMLDESDESGRVATLRKQRRIQSEYPEFIDRLLNNKLNYRQAYKSQLEVPFFPVPKELNISSQYIVIYKRNDTRGSL
jgi:hypothetical protein